MHIPSAICRLGLSHALPSLRRQVQLLQRKSIKHCPFFQILSEPAFHLHPISTCPRNPKAIHRVVPLHKISRFKCSIRVAKGILSHIRETMDEMMTRIRDMVRCVQVVHHPANAVQRVVGTPKEPMVEWT